MRGTPGSIHRKPDGMRVGHSPEQASTIRVIGDYHDRGIVSFLQGKRNGTG